MSCPLFLPALSFWPVLLLIAAVLGAARGLWVAPLLGELRSHQIGTLAACLAMSAAIHWFTKRTGPSPARAPGAGALWLALALAFELIYFGWVKGFSWDRLLADYNLREGRLLPLLWLTVLLGPWLSLRLAGRRWL